MATERDHLTTGEAHEPDTATASSASAVLPGPAQLQFEAIRGALIRRRTELGISMSELARQIGISPSMVSQIERGQSLPSVATLFALANALGAKVDAFFSDPETTADPGTAPRDAPETTPGDRAPSSQTRSRHPTEHDLYFVPADRRNGIDIRGGVRWEQLTPVPLEQIEFLELIYAPRAQSDPNLYRHPGVEMVYVVEGRFVIFVGFERYELSPGDSIAFPSSRPHRYVNPTDATSRAVTVILHEPLGTSQPFSIDSLAQALAGDTEG